MQSGVSRVDYLYTHKHTHVNVILCVCVLFLNSFVKVFPDGTYQKSPLDKISYVTMVFICALIVTEIPLILSRTVTIAVRYSVVRRQTQQRQK